MLLVIYFFLFTFSYLIGFTANLIVPKGIDGELSSPLWLSILINFGLILLFGVQHSIMARQWFKKWLTRLIPAAAERSTFVLFSSLALLILFYAWQPLGGTVWILENQGLIILSWVVFGMGYGLVLWSSFQINHFDLFGLRQAWLYYRGKAYTELAFKTPFLYRYVRHPLYLGLLLAFWSAPIMSYTRLLFALLFTIYVLRAIRWEESDLVRVFGEKYRQYKARVPMILPSPFRIGGKQKEPVYKAIAKRRQE